MNNRRIAVIGLGYVGEPLARLFSEKYPTTGFDISTSRVAELNSGTHPAGLSFTDSTEDIKDADFYVIAVPTPVTNDNHPDLGPLLSASDIVGKLLNEGDYVVYESTVYPGVTEEECIPVLEHASGLRLNKDFFVGYSPERINPGDKVHTLSSVTKLVSASSDAAADTIASIYGSVLENGVFKTSCIKVAEAAKILENTQRDVNIAFMNEAAKIFNAMGIDTGDVIDAAATKWNFMDFRPGLVGGHCISVDPYYFIDRAKVYGVIPRVMAAARNLNEGMGAYTAERVIRCMNLKGIRINLSSILILGFSFKENCPDIRNTKVADIVCTFSEFTDDITICDPVADKVSARSFYKVEIVRSIPRRKFDAVILCVPHSGFLSLDIRSLLKDPGVFFDVKGSYPKNLSDGRL